MKRKIDFVEVMEDNKQEWARGLDDSSQPYGSNMQDLDEEDNNDEDQ